MLLTFANGIQPMSSGFFTSIGKAGLGIIMSLTRQVIFLLPLIIIFPMFMGIDGVMYAGPIADAAAFVLAVVFCPQRTWKNEKSITFHISKEQQKLYFRFSPANTALALKIYYSQIYSSISVTRFPFCSFHIIRYSL